MQTSIDLSAEQLKRIEALLKNARKRNAKLSRADMLREIIVDGIRAQERNGERRMG